MKTLSEIFASANSNINETEKQAISRVKTELSTLSGVIKALKAQSTDTKGDLDLILASYDLEIKTLTPKAIMGIVAPALFNEEGKVCKVRRNYEYEDVQIYRVVEGKPMPVCKEGKPVTRKMPRLDNEGNKIVKDYTLCIIKKWDIDTLFEVLRQSAACK